jgi:hypothetical protein
MNKIIFLIIFLASFTTYSQSFRLGAAGNLLAGNKYYNYSAGPSLLAEYGFKKVPLTINASVRFSLISEMNDKYLPGYSNNSIGIGASINYLPFSWKIQPYLGLGVYYYSNDISQGGNAAFVDGYVNYLRNEESNVSAEFTGGIKLSADTPINFLIEITQTISKSAELISADPVDLKIIKKTNIAVFNSLLIRFGILFKI